MVMPSMKTLLASILKWTEKYTKTDMTYLAKGGFWLSATQGAAILSSLLLSVAFANLVSPEVYGQYRFVTAAATIIAAFSLTGMATSIVQSVARGFEGTLQSGVKENLRWSVGVIVLSLCTALYYFINENQTLALSFVVIAVTSPIITSTSLYQSFLNGKKDFKQAALMFSIHKTLLLGIMGVTLLLTKQPILIISIYFITEAIIASTFYLLTLKKYAPNSKVESNNNFNKHLSIMDILKIVGNNVDKIFVFQQMGAVELAMYAFARAPITELSGIDKIFGSLALPKLSQRTFIEIKQSLPRKVFLLTLAAITIMSVYIYSAPYLFSFLFPQYIGAVPYSQVYALILIFSPGILFSKALIAHQKTQALYILKTVPLVLKIVLMLIFIPFFSLWGVIVSLLISQMIHYSFLLYFFFKSK